MDDDLNIGCFVYAEDGTTVVGIEPAVAPTLTEIKLPSNQKDLPPYLFAGCKSLKKVYMPLSVNGFPEGLFQGCASLQEIPFRAGIQELFPKVFEGCESIKSVVIPATVNAIRSRAFADCKNLETVVLAPRMYACADDAFEGCTNIKHIRIDEENKLFYINQEDGCLYERNVDGDDICKIKVASVIKNEVQFYKDNVDEENEPFFTDEELYEEDDTFFSSEVNEEEVNTITNNYGESTMEEENKVDDMLADIMGEEKQRNESVGNEIGVSNEESKILSETMDVMHESSASNGASVSNEELANLFGEPKEPEVQEKKDADPNEIDGKTKILLDNVKASQVIICETKGEVPDDFDLFVIAEKDSFSEKLIACAKKIARIQDLRRIILLSGLPLDNDEFMQFYFHFMSKKNVVVACMAEGPTSLSDYCKTLCEQSRVSLDKESLTEQRKRIGVKNNNLIKIIVRDVD